MKKPLLIFQVVLLLTGCSAQRKNSTSENPNAKIGSDGRSHVVIRYDALNGEFKDLLPIHVKRGTPLSLKFINVFPDSLKQPEIKVVDIKDEFAEAPESLLEVANPQKNDKDSGGDSIIAKGGLPTGIKTQDTTSINEFSEAYVEFSENYRELQRLLGAGRNIIKLVSQPLLDSIKTKEGLKDLLGSYSLNSSEPMLTSQKKVKQLLNDLHKDYTIMVSLESKILDSSKESGLSLSLKLFDKEGKEAGQGNLKIPSKNHFLFAGELSGVREKAKKVLSDSAQVAIYNEVMDLALLANKINNTKFSITTNPVIVDGEGKTIEYKLLSQGGKVLREIPPINIKTEGGWMTNFSTGYFLSFASNESYTTVYNSEGTAEGLLETQTDVITHALGGLMHVYKRSSSSTPWGFSSGISLTTDGNIGFYAGPSIFFLSDNRLVFTVGYSLLKLDRLNKANVILEGDSYQFRNSSNVEVKYDKVYSWAPFLGVTYNLGK